MNPGSIGNKILWVFGISFLFIWVSCFKDLTSDLDNLSPEDQKWLMDNDGDGFADSIKKYVPDCENNLDSCFKFAKDTFTLPHLDLDSGTFNEAKQITITKISKDFDIRYTLDGTEPDVNSAYYDLPLIFSDTVTIKVALFDREDRIGSIVTRTFNISVTDSVMDLIFSPDPSTPIFYESVEIRITTTSDSVKIYYSLDGSTPDENSTLFSDSFLVFATTTVKAIGYSDFLNPSSIFEATFNVSPLQVLGKPVSDQLSGEYPSSIEITLSVPNDNIAEIWYTLDESDPDSSGSNSILYTNPISIPDSTDSTVVMAIAFRKDYHKSDISRYVYQIKKDTAVITNGPEARNVFITGTPKEGNTLTGSYDYFDAEGDLESGTTFKWYRDDQAVANETDTTYLVTNLDIGTTIKFEVTPRSEGNTNNLGNPSSYPLNTQITGLQAPTATSLFIGGNAKQGGTISGVYTYIDADGDLESGSTYRWLRDGQEILGATDSTYAIQFADSGKVITFEVTPRSMDSIHGEGIPVVSPGTLPVTGFNKPTAKDLSILGLPKQGTTLSAVYTYVDSDGDTESGSLLQWFRNSDSISGETGPTYAVTFADSGLGITFQLIPKSTDSVKTEGEIYTSPATNPVTGFNPPSAKNLSIEGSRTPGELLTGNYIYEDLEGDLELGSTFRWLRGNVAIGGAIAKSYVVQNADLENTITFEVTPHSVGTFNVVGQPQTVQTFVGAKLILISAGGKSFDMGSDSGDADEKPVHTISFSNDFYMDSTEVTQGQYSPLMTSTYSDYTDPDWSTFGNGATYPAFNLNWFDAVLYCNARSKRDGLDTVYSYTSYSGIRGNGSTLTGLVINSGQSGYRLPSEAEWEYAARGGTTTKYFWGDTFDGAYAWYFLNSSNLEEVGQKLPNNYGLYDILGNVQEWVNDGYDSTYYTISPGVSPQGPNVDTLRVLRGGSRTGQENFLRVARRSSAAPDYKLFNIGFRCVRN